mgnify:CR=1 FL=1
MRDPIRRGRYIYVCMYVCMYACILAIHEYVYIIYVCIHIPMYACIYVYVCVCARALFSSKPKLEGGYPTSQFHNFDGRGA